MPSSTIPQSQTFRQRSPGSQVLWVLVVVAPLLLAAVAAVAQWWVPTGDWALIELGVHDAVHGDPPQHGAYSRFGWNHPGPALTWLLVPLYALTGQQSWALPFGVGLWNVVFIGVALLVARRCGPTFQLLVALAALAQFAVLGLNQLIDPWNPTAAVAPFFALVVLAVAALAGDRAAGALVLLLASFVTQFHVGYLPLVAPSVLVATWALLRAPRRAKWIGAAAVGLVVVWLPTALDQVMGERNLTRIIESLAATQDVAGVGAALDTTVGALTFGLVPGDSGIWSVTVAIALGGIFGLLGWIGTRKGWGLPIRAFVLATAQVVVAAVATSRISGTIEDWLILWWVPIAMFWWTTAAWIVVADLKGRHATAAPGGRGARAVRPLVTALAFALIVVAVRDPRSLGEAPDPAGLGGAVARLTPAVLELAGSSSDAVELRTLGDEAGWVGDGLGLQLEKAGIAVRVPDEGINRYKWRAQRLTPSHAPVDHQLWVVKGRGVDHLDRVRTLWPGNLEVCGVTSSIKPDPARERIAESERRLFERLDTAGRADLVASYLNGDPLVGRSEFGELRGAAEGLGSLRDADDVLVVSACSDGAPRGG